ncbi:MAG: hypothetical protein DRP35_10450 [Candidatus Zixiibacteriota bacterium]|nr:MAG: hypothetical protein DRP35_10450 [candidate division Zixibacteria bacterium]
MLENKNNNNSGINMEQNLVMEIKSGNKKALKMLVEKHKKMAYQVALGIVGNRDDAHDISQEAFIRVYRSINSYDESKPFIPWFYTIITNLCRTWLRKRTNRENKTVDIDDNSYLMVTDKTPETNLIQKEIIQNLNIALAKLPFEDKEIISLQHFRGMSYDEIARLLNIPRGTVMSRLYYARKKLARLLMEDSNE